MNALSYTALRANLSSTMERVCEDHDPVIITKKREPSVVMISLEDYESMEETAFLMRNPENVKRLFKSIEEMKQGKCIKKTVEELEVLENA